MAKIFLVHWRESELPERVSRLKKAGHRVTTHCSQTTDGLRVVKSEIPDAIVIDLSRLPSHGRAVGFAYRQSKATRSIPLIFVEGAADKVKRIKNDMPDATYTTWSDVASSIRKAMTRRPANYVVPKSMSGYSGTPLPKKLGVDKAETVALLDAPKGFEAHIAGSNTRNEIRRGARGTADVVIWFVMTEAKFRAGLKKAIMTMDNPGALWIAWPKKASGVASDLSEGIIRATALANGIVDCKVCAIDATWSGLKFARRRGTVRNHPRA